MFARFPSEPRTYTLPELAVSLYHNHSDMPTAVDLLRVIASTPDLPGAACVDHRDLFDACTGKAAGRPGTYARAVRICAACPTLRECRAWVTSLAPRERPPGVTAGLIQRCR